MKKTRLIALLGALLGVCSSGHAAVVLAWDTTGDSAATSITSDFEAAGLQQSTLSYDTSVFTDDDVLEGFSVGGGVNVTDLAGAISGDLYMPFTITPDSGFQFSISEIELVGADNVNNDNSRWALFTSATGGFDDVSDQVGSTFAVANRDGEAGTFGDLSGEAALQNIAGPLEVRLYLYSEDGNGFNDHAIGYRSDNPAGTGSPYGIEEGYELVVNGSVSVIPEPSTFALFAGALAIGVLFARRRRA